MNRSGRTIGSVLASVALVASGLIFGAPPVAAGTLAEDAAAAVAMVLIEEDCSMGLSGYVGNLRVSIREARMGYYTGSIGSSSRVSITKQPLGQYAGSVGSNPNWLKNSWISITKQSLGQYAGSVGSRLNRLKRSSINISKDFGGQYTGSVGSNPNRLKNSSIDISKNFGGQYTGSVGKSRVSLNCGISAGGGVSPSTPNIEPEAIETPAPAPEIPSPTTEVDTPTSAVGQNVGLSASPNAAPLPAGAVQMESGLNAYVHYVGNNLDDGLKPNDTCFINPSVAKDQPNQDRVKYSVRRGETLSWREVSNISGVEYCADGPFFNFSVWVKKKGAKNCKEIGQYISVNERFPGTVSFEPRSQGAITNAGGIKAKKKGKCVIGIRAQRGGMAIIHGEISLRIR